MAGKSNRTVFQSLIAVWPLLFGIGLLSTSGGLQSTLLGLRAEYESFPTEITGFIMAAYYVGFLVGCRFVPNMIRSVGHIRVFAALSSIASTTILMQGIFVDPYTWGVIRAISGFCFCGLFIITESWLNQVSSSKQRGRILSAYIFILNAGQFSGQYMIALAPIDSTYLFILVSALISVALAPITLSNKPAPKFKKTEALHFSTMIKEYPLPMSGVFFSGLFNGTLLGLGPLYASMLGYDTIQIAGIIAAYILGNAILPVIAGPISDKYGRRAIIHLCASGGILACTSIILFGPLYALMFFLGGIVATLYTMSITFLNDQIKKKQIVSASRALIMFSAIGSVIGPSAGGFLLSNFGANSLFYALCASMSIFFCFVTFRMIVGKRIKRRKDFVNVPTFSAPSVMRLNQPEPDVSVQKEETPSSEKATI